MIRKRISIIPSDEQEFDKVKDNYDEALKKLDTFREVSLSWTIVCQKKTSDRFS